MSSRRASSRSPFRPSSGASGSARGRSCPGSRAPRSCWRAWSASRSRADCSEGGFAPHLRRRGPRRPLPIPPIGGARAKPVLEPAEPALERGWSEALLPEAEGLGGELGDVAADREGGGRRRRGRVEDVDRVGLRDDAEVVYERAVRAHRLCAGARAAAREGGGGEPGGEPLEGPRERRAAWRAAQLVGARA